MTTNRSAHQRYPIAPALTGLLLTALSGCADRTPTTPEARAPNDAVSLDITRPATWSGVSLVPMLPDERGAYPNARNEAYGINVRGWVVGWSDASWRGVGAECRGTSAYLWRPGSAVALVNLTRPLGSSTCNGNAVAHDINDSSVVVGWFASGGGDKSPFRWTQATGPVRMARGSGSIDIVANAINNPGVAVGYKTSLIDGNHAVKWTSPTTLVDIHPAGWFASEAVDINDNGTIVGIACRVSYPNCEIVRWTPLGVFSSSGRRIGRDVARLFDIPVRPLSVNGVGFIAGSQPLVATRDTSVYWWGALLWGGLDRPSTVAEVSGHGRTVGWFLESPRTAYTTVVGGAPQSFSAPEGFKESWFTGVNLCGDLVGVARSATTRRAMLWRAITCDKP